MKLTLTVKCGSCENWTKVELDVKIGVEIHLGCSRCGIDVGTFKAISEGDEE